jgi:hypothetical protein
MPHRSDRWPMPVRPMVPVRPVDSASQAGGNNNCAEMFQEASMTPLGPGTKTTSKTQTEGEEKPSQNLAQLLETYQELTSNTSPQRHTNQTVHTRQIPRYLAPVTPVTRTGQTGQSWVARGEQQLAGQLLQIQIPISRFTPRIRTRLWGYPVATIWSTKTC